MKTRIQRLFLMLVCAGLLAMPMAVQAQLNSTNLFTGSETNITLPPGTYTITAYGAEGGADHYYDGGGQGAEMEGKFYFSTSTTLTLLVGGGGVSGNNFVDGGGGGGGSFVVNGSAPLVVAGGGGGGGGYGGGNGNLDTSGGSGIGSGTGGGSAGSGGGGYSSGGGGGYSGSGGGGSSGGGGGSFLDGGAGGTTFYGSGGYGSGGYGGGGGGGGYNGGGGGGYSGGGSGYGGGGGGSIIDSSAITNLAEISGIASPDDSSGNGEIIITEVFTPTFIFTSNNGAITITSYTGSGGAVVIPNAINGLPVTSIGNGAFSYNSSLTNVNIGTNVTSIGNQAFYDCVNLTGSTIPNSVTTIGSLAFAYCHSLTNITIPSSVISIGDYAFTQCSVLTSAYFQGNAPPDDGTVFLNDNGVTTVYYLAGTTGWSSTFGGVPTVEVSPQDSLQVTISPAGAVTAGAQWQVDGGALENSGAVITNLSVGNHTVSFTTVSGWATPTNQTVSISNNSTNTAGGTYVSSSPYTGAINGNNTITITGYTGSGGAVVIPDTIGGLPVTGIGQAAFYNDESLTSVKFGTNVTSIGYVSFAYCNNLTNVTIGTNITSIGVDAFAYCISLTSVTIPSSVTNIGDDAFSACYNLTSVYFQGNAPPNDGTIFYDGNGDLIVYYLDGTTGWGSTFGGANAEQSQPQFTYTVNNGVITITRYDGSGGTVVIPNTINGFPVTGIAGYAFLNVASVTNVVIDTNITSIGAEAFYFSTGLISVTIPNSVTSIGDYAFDDCSSLVNVTIPDSVTSIGQYVFAGCSSLTSMTIPSSVTSIGGPVFAFCSSLTNITVDASNPDYSSLNGVWFDKVQVTLIEFPPGLGGNYVIPNSVTSIGRQAFANSPNLTSVIIPNGVTSIGDYAFANCSSLTAAYFHGNAPYDDGTVFSENNGIMTVYYLPGTTGWGSTFGGVPAVLLNPPSAFSLSIALTNMSFTAQAQNLFESDLNSGNIYEFITNGTPSTFASGLFVPIGLAFNSAGNLFELDSGSGSIYEFTNNAGTLSSKYIIFASGLNNPRGLAFDKNGNLFVANTGGQNILEFTNNAGALSTSYIIFASGLTGPLALAFNSAGNLFVSDAGTATYNSAHIYEYTPLGAQSTISAVPTQPFGLAFDSAGDLFVTDVVNNLSGSGIIYEFTNNADALSSSYAIFASGLWYPEGLAFDSAGNLFESDGGSDNIFEFTNCVAAEKGTFASGLNHPSGLAFSPIVTNSTFSVSNKMFARIVLNNGQIGSNYLIQATANLSSSNWTTLTNVTLPSQPYIYIDYSSYTNSQQFYRAVLQ